MISLAQTLRGVAIGLTVLTGGAAAANDLLATRLSDLLGQEKKALDMVPSSRLTALTVPPSADERGLAHAASDFEYSRAYLQSQPAPSGGAEFQCLAQALYFEARGEPIRGQFAVAEVILNRRDSSRFPSTICGVVNQGTGRRFACQFSFTCDGRPETIGDPASYDTVARVARAMLDGKAPRSLTSGATHYHAHWVSPSWSRRFARTAEIGVHTFYRQPG